MDKEIKHSLISLAACIEAVLFIHYAKTKLVYLLPLVKRAWVLNLINNTIILLFYLPLIVWVWCIATEQ